MKNKRKISQPIIILKRTGLSLFASGIAYAALTENTQENIPPVSSRLERCNINHEPVFNITFQHSLPGRINILNIDQFNI